MDQERAADALGILRSGEERVRQQTLRQKALTLGVAGGLTLLGFARKDIRHPVVRRLCGVAWVAGTFGYGYWQREAVTVFARDATGDLVDLLSRVAARAQQLQQLREDDPSLSTRDDPELNEALEALRPAATRLVALGVATTVAERVVVAMLRRSRLRYPNVAAGVVLAVSRTAFAWFGVNQRLVGRARVDPVEREV